MPVPRAKFKRQTGNAQNGGREDEGVLVSHSLSDFARGFGWFSPRLPAPHSLGVAVFPGAGGVSVPCTLTL